MTAVTAQYSQVQSGTVGIKTSLTTLFDVAKASRGQPTPRVVERGEARGGDGGRSLPETGANPPHPHPLPPAPSSPPRAPVDNHVLDSHLCSLKALLFFFFQAPSSGGWWCVVGCHPPIPRPSLPSPPHNLRCVYPAPGPRPPAFANPSPLLYILVFLCASWVK